MAGGPFGGVDVTDAAEEQAMQRTRRQMMATGIAASSMLALPSIAVAAERANGMDRFIDQAREGVRDGMARYGVVGASAALIIEGAPVWVECFGQTGGAASRPIDRRTIFSIQSTSKHVCATAIMLAVQRGLLDLDRPIRAYLPDFTVNSRHEPDPVSAMTLRTLLSHHAGFTHEAPVGNNFIPDSPSFEAHVESIQRTWLRYPVGERHAYSNLGIDLAGYVLQRAAGMPYAECLRQWIFAPLGMRDTTAATDVYVGNPNRAIGHAVGFETVPLRIPLVASGGVYTSIDDLVRYAEFHLGRGRAGERQLLAEPLWQEMHTFRYACDYALGVARFPHRFEGHEAVLFNHNGGGFGFGCHFYYAPAEQLAWIALFNGVTKAGPDPAASFDPIMPGPILEARYGPQAPPPVNTNPAKTPAPERLQSLVGLWMNGDAVCHAAVVEGQLCLTFGGAAPNRLVFTSDDEAWVADGPARGTSVRFHPAKGLEAQHFELPIGTHWDFIDGPSLPRGPVGAEYDDRLGDYDIHSWGKPVARIRLTRKNGYIYANDIPTAPFVHGVLFGGLGENLDLTGATPTVRSIELTRV
jgi:CubicO group peptidase (beta-lactamase class C family)